LRSCSIKLDSISAILIKPTVEYFEVTMRRVIAFFHENVSESLFTFWSKSGLIGAIVLQIVPFIVLTNEITNFVGT
jgi:hypothetical protein